ncbi:MAG TPA: CBS domain-containing protein [Acidimicrobiia bacterium]|nr:CBS domain-containing protein [Acidimicrobiia bacterium]
MRVLDLMTTEVATVTPDVSLKEAARLMTDIGVSGIPVLDENERLVGIITEADFLAREAGRVEPRQRRLLDALFSAPQVAEAETVEQVMTHDPVVIYPEASLTEAARVMVNHGVKRLPVVDADGNLRGVISRADVVAAFTRPDDVIEDEIREDVIRRILFLEEVAVNVSVVDGVVTLSGSVPTKSDARLLEELTRRLDGVVRLKSDVAYEVDDQRPVD